MGRVGYGGCGGGRVVIVVGLFVFGGEESQIGIGVGCM